MAFHTQWLMLHNLHSAEKTPIGRHAYTCAHAQYCSCTFCLCSSLIINTYVYVRTPTCTHTGEPPNTSLSSKSICFFVEMHFVYETPAKPPRNQAETKQNQPPLTGPTSSFHIRLYMTKWKNITQNRKTRNQAKPTQTNPQTNPPNRHMLHTLCICGHGSRRPPLLI